MLALFHTLSSTFYIYSNCAFTDYKKSQHDDDDSGVGPSMSATKSTTVSEVSYKMTPSLN